MNSHANSFGDSSIPRRQPSGRSARKLSDRGKLRAQMERPVAPRVHWFERMPWYFGTWQPDTFANEREFRNMPADGEASNMRMKNPSVVDCLTGEQVVLF